MKYPDFSSDENLVSSDENVVSSVQQYQSQIRVFFNLCLHQQLKFDGEPQENQWLKQIT
mgnify:CR=1 FL=1